MESVSKEEIYDLSFVKGKDEEDEIHDAICSVGGYWDKDDGVYKGIKRIE